MTIKTTLALVLVVAAGLFGGVNEAYAQYYSQGGSKYQVVIDKKISDLQDAEYRDNIPASKKLFREKDQIDFKLIVENTGNSQLNQLKVTDTLPKYFKAINFPGGLKDGLIEVTIDVLGAGETKTFNIRGVIAETPAEAYADQKWQLTNKACVANDLVSDCDTASYFVGGKVIPVTGNEMIVIESMIFGGLGVVALKLKKLIRGY